MYFDANVPTHNVARAPTFPPLVITQRINLGLTAVLGPSRNATSARSRRAVPFIAGPPSTGWAEAEAAGSRPRTLTRVAVIRGRGNASIRRSRTCAGIASTSSSVSARVFSDGELQLADVLADNAGNPRDAAQRGPRTSLGKAPSTYAVRPPEVPADVPGAASSFLTLS